MSELLRYRFSVEEYHRMADAGLFGEDDRVELLDGEVVEMAPIGSRHAACVISEEAPLVKAAPKVPFAFGPSADGSMTCSRARRMRPTLVGRVTGGRSRPAAGRP